MRTFQTPYIFHDNKLPKWYFVIVRRRFMGPAFISARICFITVFAHEHVFQLLIYVLVIAHMLLVLRFVFRIVIHIRINNHHDILDISLRIIRVVQLPRFRILIAHLLPVAFDIREMLKCLAVQLPQRRVGHEALLSKIQTQFYFVQATMTNARWQSVSRRRLKYKTD